MRIKVSLLIVLSLTWLMGTRHAVAAENTRVLERTDTAEIRQFRIYYPVNKSQLYPDYMANPRNLEIIRNYLAESPRVDSIVIYSYASPEGPYEFNKELAHKRGITAKRYIQSMMPDGRELPDSLIHLRPEAENWEGLREEVFLNYHESDRAQVLDILDSELTDAEKKRTLQRLNAGRSWQYILRHIMPQLRYATWISVWAPIFPTTSLQELCIKTKAEHIPQQPTYVDMFIKQPRTILALKSNLLYDALTWFNFSVEVPFSIKGHHFSALYQHQFPWWTWGENSNEYSNRFLSIGGEVRWWFAPQYHVATAKRLERKRLNGWFAGIYGLSGMYDFQWKRAICYQGEFWSTGISMGYAMPIGKRANMELSLSAGYASIPYRHYTPTEDYKQLIRNPEKQGRWHYFGPTRAEVSIVFPINMTKTVKWKGGKQ